MKGTLYLIPSPLGDTGPDETVPQPVLDRLRGLQHIVAEEVRTVRRYLSRAGLKGRIDTLSFRELNEHTPPEAVEQLLEPLLAGYDVGLISEAGLPAVADPGAALVELAHRRDIPVVPLVGPSSLMLALMASGMNGQCFAFHGYLPVRREERRRKIAELERESAARRMTQLFIETPYRNDALLEDLVAVCRPQTRLCLAIDLTLPQEQVRSWPVSRWKRELEQAGREGRPVAGKRPCVFLLQG